MGYSRLFVFLYIHFFRSFLAGDFLVFGDIMDFYTNDLIRLLYFSTLIFSATSLESIEAPSFSKICAPLKLNLDKKEV